MVLWQLLLYTLSAWMYYSLLAIGFGFTLRSIKFFNFSYGGAFLVGSYMAFFLYRMLGINFFVSILCSFAISGLYLLLCYKFVFSILLRRKAKTLVSLIASFGLLAATSAGLGMLFGNQLSLAARKLSDIYTIDILGASLNIVQVLSITVTPVIIFFLAYLRRKTRFGVAMRAIEDDSEVAELVGISKEGTLMKIFFVTPSFFPATYYGGPIFSTYNLARALTKNGLDIRVISTNANGKERLDKPTGIFIKDSENLQIKYYKSLDSRGTSISLLTNLKRIINISL